MVLTVNTLSFSKISVPFSTTTPSASKEINLILERLARLNADIGFISFYYNATRYKLKLGSFLISSVSGAIQAAGDIGADSGELAKSAVMGTLKAADEIGSEAGSIVRKALLNAAALPHDIIDALLTGKTE
ncbi:MAG: hypothetical protein Q8Q15_01665 [bacterium]|nr:hypothetical protein [bacterium]